MTSRGTESGPRLLPTGETKISELLQAYPDMIELLARHTSHFELLRRPIPLCVKLEDRCCKYATEETESGWFETPIWK
jgi:hypothetical protein